ncbi:MAG: hypothetical protein RR657_01740 [Peptostreptococcaceae bacterium]
MEFTKAELLTIGCAIGTIANDMIKSKHPKAEEFKRLYDKINSMYEQKD